MKALIIGFGSIGKRHSSVLVDLLGPENVEIVSKSASTSLPIYKDLESVNDISKFDYFIIASETVKHKDQLLYIESRIKGKKILIEKPIFSENHNPLLCSNFYYVGYNLRFNPILQKLKQIIEIGEVLLVDVYVGQYLPQWRPDTDYRKSYSANKEKGGGVLLDLSHEIDYIQWLFGKMLNICALNGRVSDLEITSDDFVRCIGMTEHKIRVSLSMDYISKCARRQIVVHCHNDTIICDLIGNKCEIWDKNGKKEEIKMPDLQRNYTYQLMHQSILDGHDSFVCTHVEAISVLDTIEKIRNSSKEIESEWGL